MALQGAGGGGISLLDMWVFSLSLGRNEFPRLANPDTAGFATLSYSHTEHIPLRSPGPVFSSKALSALGEVLLLHILLLILCKIST